MIGPIRRICPIGENEYDYENENDTPISHEHRPPSLV